MSNAIRTNAPLRALVLIAAAVALLAMPTAAAAKGSNGGDRDGMPTKWEKRNKLDPRKNDARRDADKDGLVNVAEYNSRTKARDKDSDNDGLRDSLEDPDRDKLHNRGEYLAGTDPLDPDNDDDGVKDGAEGAGSVESFEDGLLTVRLFTGGALTGRYDDCAKDKDERLGDEYEPGGDNSDYVERALFRDEDGDGVTDLDPTPDTGVEGDTDGDGVADPDYDPSLAEEEDESYFSPCDRLVRGAVIVELKYAVNRNGASFHHLKFKK